MVVVVVVAALLAGAVPEEAKPADAAKADAAGPQEPASDVPEIPFTKVTLDNGLELLHHVDKRLPVVCVSVWYHVGAFHEEQGKTGFAHLFEHLMFQGTPQAPADTHIKLLEAAGASFINGSTDFDRTNYFECVPKNELELALWLESSRMGWLAQAVDKAKLDEQRNVVKNERRQYVDNVPYGLPEEKLWHTIFPAAHPYYGAVIGSLDDLDRASLDDVAKFYDNYYAPSNATLAIAGDIELADAQKLTEKFFKTLPKWPKPTARAVAPPVIAQEIRLDLEDRVAQLPKVEVSWFVPAAYAPQDAEVAVLAHFLGYGNGSRLHQALVVDSELAQEVTVTHASMQNVSVFTIAAIVRQGAKPEDVLNAIDSQVEALRDFPPAAEDIQRAVTTFEANRIFALQLALQRAETLQHYNHFVGDPGFLAKDIARYRAVTSDSTLAAINAHLVKERRAVLMIKPGGATPAGDPNAPTPPPTGAPPPEPATAPAPSPAPVPADGAAKTGGR